MRPDTIPGGLRRGALLLGFLSVLLFWLPWAAPLIQGAAVLQTLRAARWGVADTASLSLGLGGGLTGFGLFLTREQVWAFLTGQ